MGISVFPAAGGGESVVNDFVVDLNDTTNNTAALSRQYAAGAYSVSLASGDTSFDIYLIAEDGSLVGYSNENTIVASAGFDTVVVLGVVSSEVVSFTYTGSVTNADTSGQEVTAGAYLTSISPSDLPDADDTANVIGGNFSTAVEINFTSGTISLPAKNIVRTDSTALVVTRPDALYASENPWSLEAINPGVTPPTGSNAHILAGTVTGGSGVVWVTTSPITSGTAGAAYAGTLVATDADGAVTYSITAGTFPGLSLNSATGVLSGTPTGSGTATVRALDQGGNFADRDFAIGYVVATGGVMSTVGNYTVHTFNSSSDFVAFDTIANAEYLVLAGGGGGGDGSSASGGGGGGGLLSSITGFSSGSATSAITPVSISAGTVVVTVGAGGAGSSSSGRGTQGSSSVLTGYATAIGGGGGGGDSSQQNGGSGGSGGGARGGSYSGGSGTTGQGFSGGNATDNSYAAGGGGTYEAGESVTSNGSGKGGKGTHNFLDQRGWGAGGGGGNSTMNIRGGDGGGSSGSNQTSYAGKGSDGNAVGGRTNATSGVANFGGGGGGDGGQSNGGSGGSGKVIVRYEV